MPEKRLVCRETAGAVAAELLRVSAPRFCRAGTSWRESQL